MLRALFQARCALSGLGFSSDFEANQAMVTIRLTRRGAKKQPFYHVVVTDSRQRQGGQTLEQVGYFNPIPAGKQVRLELNLERVDYWLSKGALPTNTMHAMIKKARRSAGAKTEAASA